MFVALWEFEVKPGSEERFEKPMARMATGYGSSRATPTIMRRGWYAIRFAPACI